MPPCEVAIQEARTGGGRSRRSVKLREKDVVRSLRGAAPGGRRHETHLNLVGNVDGSSDENLPRLEGSLGGENLDRAVPVDDLGDERFE